MILAPTGTIHGPPPEQEPLPLAAPGEVVTSRPRDWFKGKSTGNPWVFTMVFTIKCRGVL